MMKNQKSILICNCEGTINLDSAALTKALDLDTPLKINTQLCRSQIEVFENELKNSTSLLVGCTQEAPMFLETAESCATTKADLHFTNIRERAGWTKSKNPNLNAKIAALIKEATLEIPSTPSVSMKSNGELVILADGDEGLEAAQYVKERLNVTIILSGMEEVSPPNIMDVPIFRGDIKTAIGVLGSFKLEVNNYSPTIPASKSKLEFENSIQSGSIDCDLILDLRKNLPLFTQHEFRDGYLKPESGNQIALFKALLKVTNLIGEFEKPRYINYEPNLCAHARSEISGCNLCIDHCPVAAITSDGEKVKFDPFICGGCGSCSNVCPTGAAKYDVPAGESLTMRIRTLINHYLKKEGTNPIILFHDTNWGEKILSILAREIDGLPTNILPLAVNSLPQIGLESILSASVYGAEHIVYLCSPLKQDDKAIIEKQGTYAKVIFDGLGYGADRLSIVDDNDPEIISEFLWNIDPKPGMPNSDFMPKGRKRSIMSLALNNLHKHAPEPVDMIELPIGAPFGTVELNSEDCTLCLSCVGACPTGALKANNDKPQLSFSEMACVQCGLCKNTCPESVITLSPRISFLDDAMTPRILKEETPFNCVKCGKPFGTLSTIEKMLHKLKEHPMFQDDKAMNRLKMCDDCRIISMTEDIVHPMAVGKVPIPRTTDDYLREREELRRKAKEDMVSKGIITSDREG